MSISLSIIKNIGCGLIVASSLLAHSVLADDFDDGFNAYEKKDYATALIKFNKAALASNSQAQFNLGVMNEFGQGKLQNYAAAVKWYQFAAEQGNEDAQYNLAVMYYDGKGIVQNNIMAVRWYRKAAVQGHHLAQENLATSYAKGVGVKQDLVRAHMWSNIAAAADGGGVNAGKNLRIIEKHMSATQIEQAQQMAQQCLDKHFDGCQ